MANEYTVVLASAARTATTNSAVFDNKQPRAYKGLHVVIDVTVVPGVDTVTPKIEAFDTTSGKYYDLLVGTAMVATGTQVLKLYPGAVVAANVSANDTLPANWRVTTTHSAATSFTYSVGASLLG